ncbi:MAG TPA: hypothetical protein VKZ49_18910 [Polyangiaceae bacterium]|nr:hypothetical protein [Polyangiaceae bacterium]
MKHSLQLLVAASACAGLSTACAGSDRHTETPMATYTAAGEAAQLAQKNVALAEQVRAAAEQGPLGAAADEREPVVGIERELIVIEPQIEVVDEAEVDEEKVAEAESEDAASADEPTTEPLRSMEGMTAYVRRGGEEDPDGAGFHDQLTAASSELAVGSIVRVVRTDTDDSLVLHIGQSNADVPPKMLKLSGSAAQRLGLNGYSVVPIRVEVLFEPGGPGLEQE